MVHGAARVQRQQRRLRRHALPRARGRCGGSGERGRRLCLERGAVAPAGTRPKELGAPMAHPPEVALRPQAADEVRAQAAAPLREDLAQSGEADVAKPAPPAPPEGSRARAAGAVLQGGHAVALLAEGLRGAAIQHGGARERGSDRGQARAGRDARAHTGRPAPGARPGPAGALFARRVGVPGGGGQPVGQGARHRRSQRGSLCTADQVPGASSEGPPLRRCSCTQSSRSCGHHDGEPLGGAARGRKARADSNLPSSGRAVQRPLPDRARSHLLRRGGPRRPLAPVDHFRLDQAFALDAELSSYSH
mmetsp:Transcript_88018/g.246269  ORF Transcript_88018/g.246269 Transcript_88018/m.246269 type:complete len:306 (+) Transcript_88018:262-1179(+)